MQLHICLKIHLKSGNSNLFEQIQIHLRHYLQVQPKKVLNTFLRSSFSMIMMDHLFFFFVFLFFFFLFHLFSKTRDFFLFFSSYPLGSWFIPKCRHQFPLFFNTHKKKNNNNNNNSIVIGQTFLFSSLVPFINNSFMVVMMVSNKS